MVVVLPAPLGPMKPRICPRSTVSDRRSSATNSPYFFARSLATTTGSPGFMLGPPFRGRPAADLQTRGVEAPLVVLGTAALDFPHLHTQQQHALLVRLQQARVGEVDPLD